MFLPRAFRNGGMLFSVIVVIFISAISMLAFHLLLSCRAKYGGSFGDIGNAIVGPTMRIVILSSIALSQLGFVCAGIAFVAENFHSVSQATAYPMSSDTFMLLQLVVLIPLALIRHMSKIGPAATVADVFIIAGLFFVVQCDVKTLALNGVSPTVVRLFNPNHFTMTIGSAIFTFEGIGLIIPIQSSMEKPQYFEYLLSLVMALITVIYIFIGALSYLAFGDNTKIEIMSNFPQNSLEVHAVQLMYPLAVLFGVPVQLFPIIRIFETMLFAGKSGKTNPTTKWQKNAFRATLVVICGVIAYAGMENLDMFVSLTGSVACIPLVYVYPPYLHLRGVAQTKGEKAGDVCFMAGGVLAMIYTTGVTLGFL